MEQWINLPLAVSLKKMPSLYLLKMCTVYGILEPLSKKILQPHGENTFSISLFLRASKIYHSSQEKNTPYKPPAQISTAIDWAYI